LEGILVLIPRKRWRALPFLCRGVAGAVSGALERLSPRDGVEGGVLKEGERSLRGAGCPWDAFEPPRDLEGVVGCGVVAGFDGRSNRGFDVFILSQQARSTPKYLVRFLFKSQ